MSRGEKLLRLQDLGALQMAKLSGPAFDAGADQRQRADEFRVQIPRHHLRGNGARAQAQFPANRPLHRQGEMRAGADRPGKFADRHPRADRFQPLRRARVNSSYINAIFKPKVVGSAWMPWLRPIIGVNSC